MLCPALCTATASQAQICPWSQPGHCPVLWLKAWGHPILHGVPSKERGTTSISWQTVIIMGEQLWGGPTAPSPLHRPCSLTVNIYIERGGKYSKQKVNVNTRRPGRERDGHSSAFEAQMHWGTALGEGLCCPNTAANGGVSRVVGTWGQGGGRGTWDESPTTVYVMLVFCLLNSHFMFSFLFAERWLP